MNKVDNAIIKVPEPVNEPVYTYEPGSWQRNALKDALAVMAENKEEIPLIIDGQRVRTGNLGKVVMPHDHRQVLAEYHKASRKEVEQAIEAACQAQSGWRSLGWEQRCAIFLKAAELLAGKYRFQINAGAMLAGGKNVYQAEIDAACELIDFLRFNVSYARELYSNQPVSSPGVWNYVQYRPLEGFVFAVTPFNFTAIAGNLPTAPAIMGNTVVWKPASTLVYTPYILMNVLEEAGLPPGVINFIPGSGEDVGEVVLANGNLAGVHFTGSTRVFQQIWRTIGDHIDRFKTYPRIVGETGGKDFIFAHASADEDALVTAMVRGAFEYQGQKCSAASRAYIPRSIWPSVAEKLRLQIGRIRMGSPVDFRNFCGAVIDQSAYTTIAGYIDHARASTEAEILIGGNCDDSVGYFIDPTVILTTDPLYRSMVEEIFGPVLTVYVYDDSSYAQTLELCNSSSAYGLTGSVFARDREAIQSAVHSLEDAAGNFYINDKPTGSVVGQQPFGGGRASGTNDKAGSLANLMRWVSMRTIKETFDPPQDFAYPFMQER